MEKTLIEELPDKLKEREVREFFAERNFPFPAIVARAPEGVGPKAIIKAMEMVYNRRLKGEDIPRIRLVREVWQVARSLKVEEDLAKEIALVEPVDPWPWRTAFIFAAGTALVFCALFLSVWLGGC